MKKYTQNQRNIRDLKERYFKKNNPSISSSSQTNDTFDLSRNQLTIDSVVELVDVFPTIADLANISIPICLKKRGKSSLQIEQNILQTEITCSEGITLLPLIKAALKKKVIVIRSEIFSLIFSSNM